MEWISVKERLPDNRRPVFVWGLGGFCMFADDGLKEQCFGVTRFNRSKTGGDFDIEHAGRFTTTVVTHWAEIEGPNVELTGRST